MKKFFVFFMVILFGASLAFAGGNTPRSLWDEFRENQFRFENTYTGKRTTITGEVSRVSRAVSGTPTVSLTAGGISAVVCYFPDAAAASLANINPQQKITLSGVYKRKMLTSLFFEDCRLVR